MAFLEVLYCEDFAFLEHKICPGPIATNVLGLFSGG